MSETGISQQPAAQAPVVESTNQELPAQQQENVRLVFNKEQTTPENQETVNRIGEQMKLMSNDPAGVFESKPFRYKDTVTQLPSEKKETLTDLDTLIDNTKTKEVPGDARENISDLLKGELPESLHETAITTLLRWPALQSIYGNSFEQIPLESRAELLADIKKMTKSPEFTKQVQSVSESLITKYGGSEAAAQKAALENQVKQLDSEHKQAKIVHADAKTKLSNKNKELHHVTQDLKAFEIDQHGEKGAALKELDAYTSAEAAQDKTRIDLGPVVIQNLEKRIGELELRNTYLDAETDAKQIAENNRQKENLEKDSLKKRQEIENLENKTARRDALVQQQNSLREKKISLPNEIESAKQEISEKKTGEKTAEDKVALANNELAEMDQQFVADLQSIPEKAIMSYMDERLDQIEIARKKVLEDLAKETKDGAQKAITEGLLTRWKYPDRHESKSVRNTVTDPVTGKVRKVEGYHDEDITIKGESKSYQIKKDFEDVTTKESAKGLVLDILKENANTIPVLENIEKNVIDSLNTDPSFINKSPEERNEIYDREIDTAFNNWYDSQPEPWRMEGEKRAATTLYAERQNNIKELVYEKGFAGIFKPKMEAPKPIPDHENAKFLQMIEKVYGGERAVENALLQEVSKNPTVQKIANRLRAEQKPGESLLNAAKRKGNAGTLLAILCGLALSPLVAGFNEVK